MSQWCLYNKQRQKYITPDVVKQYSLFPIFPLEMPEKGLKGNYDDFLYATPSLSPFYWKTSLVFSKRLRKIFLSFWSLRSFSSRSNSSKSFFSSGLRLVGVTTLTVTCWSPRAVLCTTGTPIFFRRNERPLCVPGGILR